MRSTTGPLFLAFLAGLAVGLAVCIVPVARYQVTTPTAAVYVACRQMVTDQPEYSTIRCVQREVMQ